MKWFKHDTDANLDAKLQNVLLDYGLEGYGLYWYCIEMIAGGVDVDNITFKLEHDARIIARNTGSTPQKVEEMMRYFVNLGLFEASNGTITCMKLASRIDQSMTSNPQMRKIISSMKSHDPVMIESCSSHDKVMQDKTRLDKKKNTRSKQQAVIDFSTVLQKWNEFAQQKQLKTIQAITPNRKKKIDAAYNHYLKTRKVFPDKASQEPQSVVGFVCSVIDVAMRTHDSFHLGENDRGWRMDFDYLMQQKVIDRAIEFGTIKAG